jgi:hypothetical protein
MMNQQTKRLLVDEARGMLERIDFDDTKRESVFMVTAIHKLGNNDRDYMDVESFINGNSEDIQLSLATIMMQDPKLISIFSGAIATATAQLINVGALRSATDTDTDNLLKDLFNRPDEG